MPTEPTLPKYVTNTGLFHDHFLLASLVPMLPLHPDEVTNARAVSDARHDAATVLAQIQALWDERKAQLEISESNGEDFVAEVCRMLGMAVSSQGSVPREGTTTQRVDLTLFADNAVANDFAERTKQQQPAGERYARALAVVEVEKVYKNLNPTTATPGHPTRQIVDYLTFTGVPWGILTDGLKWRIFRRYDPPRFDQYLEINLATILNMSDQTNQQEAFWWFYAMVHRDALNRHERKARLDALYESSQSHALGEKDSLRNQAFRVVEELARGIYVTHPNPAQVDLSVLYEQAIIILYRLLFLKFAEDKEMLPVHHPIYQRYGYAGVEDELLHELDKPIMTLSESASNCIAWVRLQTLFDHLNTGNPDAGIVAYNGGLFRPDRVDGINIPDAFLARAIAHLARIELDGKTMRVNYHTLETRHLGSIYEGLLEQHLERFNGTVRLVSTAGERTNKRRISGSYYTPDYIVDHIVQHTIDPLCEGKRAEEIAQVRVLDPSMGSGHFLVSALYHLSYHHARAKSRESAVPPERLPGEPDHTFDERMRAYHAQTEPTEAEIDVSKCELVEHCLYGVDLNHLAVELTKLALWLSTLADDRALSFLDHHLRVGNSLVGANLEHIGSLDHLPSNDNGNGNGKKKNGNGKKKNGNGNGTVYQMGLFEQIVWRVQKNILAYFQQIADLPSTTPDQIHQKEQEYAHFRAYSKPFRQVANLWVSSYFGNSFTSQHSVDILEALDDCYADPPDRTKWEAIASQPWFLHAQKIADTKNHCFFHWELEFPQIFLREEKGFDVVVGNPPYVRQETFKPLKSFLSNVYPDIYHGVADLYIYFIGQGITLLRQEGWFAYINSNKWFRANYGKKLRSYLPQHMVIERIVDFGDAPIFADAITYPSILVARRGIAAPDHHFPALSWQGSRDELEHFEARISQQSVLVQQKNLSADGWQLATGDSIALFEKLRQSGTPLAEYVKGKFYYGIKTGLNEAFVVDRATRDRLIAEHPSSADILKPYLRGRDVKRWRIEFDEQYLIFTRRGIDITKYPAILAYLNQYKDRLTPSGSNGRKKGSYQWYEIQDSVDYWQQFDQPKIIIPAIADSVAYVADTRQFYSNNATSICVPDNIYYVLGLLNSSTLYWYIRQIAAEIQHGFLQFFIIYVESLPVPKISPKKQNRISNLAKQVSEYAAHRYELQTQCHHRIQSDLGNPGTTLNQKLIQWWTLDFATFRAEVKKALGQDISLEERDEWETWLHRRQESHTQYTNEIVRVEHTINQEVYRLFKLTDAEIAIIEQETQYQYGK